MECHSRYRGIRGYGPVIERGTDGLWAHRRWSEAVFAFGSHGGISDPRRKARRRGCVGVSPDGDSSGLARLPIRRARRGLGHPSRPHERRTPPTRTAFHQAGSTSEPRTHLCCGRSPRPRSVRLALLSHWIQWLTMRDLWSALRQRQPKILTMRECSGHRVRALGAVALSLAEKSLDGRLTDGHNRPNGPALWSIGNGRETTSSTWNL